MRNRSMSPPRQLTDAVSEALGLDPPVPSTERQRDYAESLGVAVRTDTQRVASAKIADALFERNSEALAALDLVPGDRVVRTVRFEHDGETHVKEQEFVVSSIHTNGRIYFKGGQGQGAWPTQVRRA